jgi:hypothetical protein
MKYFYTVVRDKVLDALITVPCPSTQILAVRRILNLHGVPEVGPGGGPGFIVAEGEVSISGSLSACEKAAKAILKHLNGPPFVRADKIYEQIKQGAMPV